MVIVDVVKWSEAQLHNYTNANMMVSFSFGNFGQVPKTGRLVIEVLLNIQITH